MASGSANAAEADIVAIFNANMAAAQAAGGGSQQSGPQPIVPLWRVRPKTSERISVNPGQFGGDVRSTGGGRVTAGRKSLDVPLPQDYRTPDFAASAFLDLSREERDQFKDLALQAGLLTMPKDGFISDDDVFGAWSNATGKAAQYNQERDKEKWLSPWEMAQRLALETKAGKGGAFDAFGPRTSSSTTKRDFTKGSDAEAVTRSLESLFASEMGRAPTPQERNVYQQLVQKVYDTNPEIAKSVTQTDAQGNSNTTTTQSGGVDLTATLLDKVRADPESAAFQSGSTYFQAAMGALGAVTG